MTRTFYSFIFILFVLLSGCKEVDKLTKFNMEYTTTVTIPSSTGVDLPFNLVMPDVESNAESTFQVNNTRKELIEEIILTQMKLTLTSPSTGDFSFLNSITVYINASGLTETKIAFKENISDNAGKELELESTGADLKEFIKKDKFTLRLNTVTDELLTSDHTVNVNCIFHVDAKIFGQ